MKALFFEAFQAPVRVTELPDPEPTADGVVIQVAAAGLCRSDWHGWMGHDSDVHLPHVPGHEFAGTIAALGKNVKNWQIGDRVTLPFSMGCGSCPQCRTGNQQICDDYYQPGFTGMGCFAEYVAVPYAEQNLVRLPDKLGFNAAAVLGCRFITAYRGIAVQGRLQGGDWVAVHACGGVGLSAIQIAKALGGRVVAVDIATDKLELAKKLGADRVLNASEIDQIPEAIREITGGGAQVSVDALGSTVTCINSIACLAKRGRHIQIGLMTGTHRTPAVPMGPVIAKELEIIGSHGMQAHAYPGMLQLITSGRINPKALLGQSISLEEAAAALMKMDDHDALGVTVIDRFR
ncbi:zinc-dependent alcohol dehydrogenase family protein [Flavilitoribacter nigricans]|uniref:Alcohol dehydrogenase n=1 Tax=Flavilitoribacter nigricans (strain ATCC 23147 / DSM 23189 / NBRC 102662 / NCIMB 1420 / SS-2) TaxID=1122177 RepID=A0A2D0NA77_FLAN2|nr:zinc-dependent alcohol dehydrogenase family protein [Flavilitoribacter nigricans]PHN04683.1 alcohol dehydrogenase [Flavilitoribacter nigricans DSM 23189 = NBRC 102662]